MGITKIFRVQTKCHPLLLARCYNGTVHDPEAGDSIITGGKEKEQI
jgi:hypothetical protein